LFEREALPHADLLYNHVLRMSNNAADAEDLAQETFLRAYRFWESYEQGTNIRAWLFRIVRNSSINRYRKETREPGTEIAPGWTCRLCAGAGLVPGD
jgi:RNA polymerase sigma-70 factor (ECF subfamily)